MYDVIMHVRDMGSSTRSVIVVLLGIFKFVYPSRRLPISCGTFP